MILSNMQARVIAVKFFLGTDENEQEGSDSDDSDDAVSFLAMQLQTV